MKKTILWFAFCLLVSMHVWAQPNVFRVQGIPRPDLNREMQNRATPRQSPLSDDAYDYSKFSFDEIRFWVGSGTNRAALVIDWYDEKGNQTAMVWGYRWHKDSICTGFDMVKAIARTDKRFLLLTHLTDLGSTVAGLGYDLNQSGNQSLLYQDNSAHPIRPVVGVVQTTQYDYDLWSNSDTDDHWRAGWQRGYWSYQVKEAGETDFEYSGVGASTRILEDGSCDGWAYMDFSSGGMMGALPRMPFRAAEMALRITSIQLGEKQLTLSLSEDVSMSCSVISEEEIVPRLQWSSSNPVVASVDQKGLVQALSVGKAEIIVTETDTQCSDMCRITVEGMNYTQGVFFLNEGWYGHNNGSINFLDSRGDWHYRAYQQENPGKELGSTSQYGTIYGDKLFIVSKQEKDPGAPVEGGRLTVCDATTLQSLAAFPKIGNADGRSFVGVNAHKGYIGTSNGIYLFDIDNLSVGDKIQGSENESENLYKGQIGTMIQTNGRVFAVNQQKGLMVIDAQSNTLQTIIAAPKEGTKQRGFGSIVQSKDGNLWLSVAQNTTGSGGGVEYLLKLDPFTLDTTRVVLPKGVSIPNSWYAWTADGFCSATQHNMLYWKNDGGWFNSTKIFEYDIDQNTLRTVFDCSTYEPSENWGIYGAGFRLHPITDEIYLSLFKSFGEQSYKVVKIDPTDTTPIVSYPMKEEYWFPAMPLFPDTQVPVVSEELTDIYVEKELTIYLGDKVSDADNIQASIAKSISSVSNEALISTVIKNDSLIISPASSLSGTSLVELTFNSNGKSVTKTIVVEVAPTSVDIATVEKNRYNIYPTVTSGEITLAGDSPIGEIQVLNGWGSVLQHIHLQSSEGTIHLDSYPSGIYFIRVKSETIRVLKQ